MDINKMHIYVDEPVCVKCTGLERVRSIRLGSGSANISHTFACGN